MGKSKPQSIKLGLMPDCNMSAFICPELLRNRMVLKEYALKPGWPQEEQSGKQQRNSSKLQGRHCRQRSIRHEERKNLQDTWGEVGHLVNQPRH